MWAVNRKTLYELATDMDADVQSEGIPKLAQWLFQSYYNKFNGELQQAIALEFIEGFIRKYLNREIFHINKEVFRSSLYYELDKYFDYLSTVQDEYKSLIDADVSLGYTEHRQRDLSDMTTIDNKVDITGSNKRDTTDGTVNKHNSEATTSSDQTSKNTGTQAVDSNSTRTDDLNSKTVGSTDETRGNAERRIMSDYPQSNVSQDVEPVFNYDYASGSTDVHSTVTGNTGTNSTTTNTGTQGVQGLTTTTNDLTTTNNQNSNANLDESSSSDRTVNETGSNSSNESSLGHNDKTVDETEDITHKQDNMSKFDKLLAILDYLDKNPYSPIYTVIEKMNKYFISMYVDEERDGWIDPDTNIIKYIVGGV